MNKFFRSVWFLTIIFILFIGLLRWVRLKPKPPAHQAHQQAAPVNQATGDAGTAFTRPVAPRPRLRHRVKPLVYQDELTVAYCYSRWESTRSVRECVDKKSVLNAISETCFKDYVNSKGEKISHIEDFMDGKMSITISRPAQDGLIYCSLDYRKSAIGKFEQLKPVDSSSFNLEPARFCKDDEHIAVQPNGLMTCEPGAAIQVIPESTK